MHRLVPLFLAAGALTLAGCSRHDDNPKPVASAADSNVTTPADGVAATPGTQGQTVVASADTGGKLGSNAAATSGTGTTGVGSVASDSAGTPAAATTSGTGTAGAATDATATSGTSASAGGADAGKQVYQQTCIACHGAGVAGAPKFGDKTAWAPRIAKGKATLYDHALHGFNALPPRGALHAALAGSLATSQASRLTL
jgi:cytochrome c5